MRLPLYLLAAIGIATVAGCGGGNGTGTAAVPTQSNQAVGPTLGKIVNRNYTVHDLGKLTYPWPGWVLSPGAGSISLSEDGGVISVYNDPPAVWTTTTVTQLIGRFTSARGLNNKGMVVGDTWPADSNRIPLHAAIWQNGEITELGFLYPNNYQYQGQPHYSRAFGINDAGRVVGESDVPPNVNAPQDRTHAFTYLNGVWVDLGTVGGSYCRATGVNNSDQVIGDGTTANNVQTHAFTWQHGLLTDLGTLPGGSYSQANALNNTGQIVGFSSRATTDLSGNQPARATTWQGGGILDLGTLGGPGSYATGINGDGVITGSAETSELRTTDEGTAGNSYSYFAYYGYGFALININDNSNLLLGAQLGFAGGRSSAPARNRATSDGQSFNVAHAFVYADHVMFDLNKLLPAKSGWELTQAHAINSSGQIVGIGTFIGQVHGFFLDPK